MCEMTNVDENNSGYLVTIKNRENDEDFILKSDVIILCTGYYYDVPNFLNPILPQFKKDPNGNLIIRKDYSLICENSGDCKIYLQNAARNSRGIADPNLSLSAWRSAVIINSIMGKEIYKTENHSSFFNWERSKNSNDFDENKINDSIWVE